MTKPIGVASDHAGLELKRQLVAELAQRGIPVQDFGTTTGDSCDYPDFAHAVGHALARGDVARVVGLGTAIDILDAFLGASFEGGRHAARVAKINAG